MHENRMEKLLNLLNEYEEKRIKKINADWKLRVKLLFKPYTKEALTNQAYKSVHNEIISKYYWFIKRLVEKDKIDTSKANDKNLNGYEIELRIRAVKELVADSEEKTVLYLNLLMLLAIQDEPVSFLISILK